MTTVTNKKSYTIYKCNFNYFDNIDDENKAYLLGFIFADGCLYKNRLKIQLAEKDLDIIEKFKKSIQSNHPIHHQLLNTSYGVSRTVVITIVHDDFKDSLNKHGVNDRKTETCKFPKTIPKKFIRHFIRGYFDGDGCISVSKIPVLVKYKGVIKNYGVANKYSINICGTPEFLSHIQKIFKNVAEVNGYTCKRHKNSKSRVRQLCYSGGKCIRKILTYMYNDSNIYLDRKFDIYRGICK